MFVIGCGLNLRHAPLRRAMAQPASASTVPPHLLLAALKVLVREMALALALWDGGAGVAAVCAAWMSHADGLGRRMVVMRGA